MKFFYRIIIAIFLIIFFIWIINSRHQIVPAQNTDGLLLYSSDIYGISFSYPSNYVLGEQDIATSDLQKYHEISLIDKNDLPVPINGEGPPAITIDLYKNDINEYTAEGWANNSKQSNLKLGEGRIATTSISGFPAISFRWSGLYEGTTIVLSKTSFIYTFNVTYLEIGAPIIQDFVKIKDSIRISN